MLFDAAKASFWFHFVSCLAAIGHHLSSLWLDVSLPARRAQELGHGQLSARPPLLQQVTELFLERSPWIACLVRFFCTHTHTQFVLLSWLYNEPGHIRSKANLFARFLDSSPKLITCYSFIYRETNQNDCSNWHNNCQTSTTNNHQTNFARWNCRR